MLSLFEIMLYHFMYDVEYCTISTGCSQLLEKTRPKWPDKFCFDLRQLKKLRVFFFYQPFIYKSSFVHHLPATSLPGNVLYNTMFRGINIGNLR